MSQFHPWVTVQNDTGLCICWADVMLHLAACWIQYRERACFSCHFIGLFLCDSGSTQASSECTSLWPYNNNYKKLPHVDSVYFGLLLSSAWKYLAYFVWRSQWFALAYLPFSLKQYNPSWAFHSDVFVTHMYSGKAPKLHNERSQDQSED